MSQSAMRMFVFSAGLRVLLFLTLSMGSLFGADRDIRIRLTAYAPSPEIQTDRVVVTAGGAPARIVSTGSLSKSRTLLLVVDPNSYSRSEIRRRVSLFGKAFAASEAGSWKIRVGIPILDGILSRPMDDPRSIGKNLDQFIMSYLPDQPAGEQISSGRVLDLIGELVRQAEKESGPVDCLLLFKDRRFEGEGEGYLNAGMQRWLTSLSFAAGSSLYGWLDGEGILRAACAGSGGKIWNTETPPGQVLEQLAEARRRGITLEIEVPRPGRSGKVRLDVRGPASGSGMAAFRAPEAVWSHVDGSEVPDHYHMRLGLESIRRAREAKVEDNFTLARHFAASAVKDDPWNSEGYFLGATAAAEFGDLQAAAALVDRAIAAVGPEERLLCVLGSTYRRLGKPAQALEKLRMHMGSASAATPALRLELARLFAATGQYEAARELFSEVLLTSPRDTDAVADLGEVLFHLGSFQEARRNFLLALEQNPKHAKALSLLAHSAAEAGNIDEALEWARKAVDGNPRDPDAHSGLAAVEAMRQNWDQAVENIQLALVLAPDRRDLNDQLVEILCRAGRQRDAITHLRRFLESNPDDVAALRKLAGIMSRLGEAGEAARILEIGASRGAPDAHELYRQAAELRERRREYGQALLDYRAMLRTAPHESLPQLNSELGTHLAALSLLVDDGREARPHHLEKELDLGGSLAALAERRDNSLRAAAKEPAVIVVPGGLSLLGRSLGIGFPTTQEPAVLERIFSFVLEAGQHPGNRAKENPICREALSSLQNYKALILYMRRQGLLAGDFDPKKPREVAFPLLSSAGPVENTKRLLRFFGIDLRMRRAADGGISLDLILKQGSVAAARQRMLRNMGINLTDRNLREVRLILGDDELPILFGPEVWKTRILGPEGKRPADLLERFLLNPNAMSLYLALAQCSETTQAALVQAYGSRELLELVKPLQVYGRYLDFEKGQLVFPGVSGSWETFLGGVAGEIHAPIRALLRKDDWRALRMYASLSRAPRSVRNYLTATTERLKNLHQMFITGAKLPERGQLTFGPPDLGRILTLMRADENGLVLPIDQRLEGAVLSGAPLTGSNAPASFRPLKVSESHLAQFLQWEESLPSRVSFSPLESIELISFLQSTYPEMLDQQSAAELVRGPVAAPAMLDLILDLSPPAPLLRRYLEYAKELSSQGPRGWGANRMRTSQSLLCLLSLLHRQGALSRVEGLRLFGSLLDRLKAAEEPAFARAVADFLSGELLPMLPRGHPETSPDDLLLEALAGPHEIREFDFEGRWLQFDAAAFQIQRMKATILHQRYTPLKLLLGAFQVMGEPGGAAGSNQTLETLKKAVGSIQAVDLGQLTPGKARESVARADSVSLMNRLNGAAKGKESANLAQLSADVAAALHTELGVTLLTYCYAYHGAPEADVMAFDSNFVRKHDFFGGNLNTGGTWSLARLEQREGAGSFLVGSISGLGFELSRIETGQWAASFGGQEERGLVPAILAGMRAIRRCHRTDRAQEYIALSVQLARELLALASLDKRLNRWCESFLQVRILPRRRDQILQAVEQGNPRRASEILSSSELFLLGQEYLARAGVIPASYGKSAGGLEAAGDRSDEAVSGQDIANPAAPNIYSPVLSRLRAIVPPQGSSDLQAFHDEIRQYGVYLRRRLGISQLSVGIAESYEQLERVGREEILYERICDLKMRMADLHHELGIPAYLAEVEGELAVRDILPRNMTIRADSWKQALEQIGRLGQEQARNWIEELLNRGILVPARSAEEKGVVTSP